MIRSLTAAECLTAREMVADDIVRCKTGTGEDMKHHAIAYSDWEAVRLSFRLGRERRAAGRSAQKKKEAAAEKERPLLDEVLSEERAEKESRSGTGLSAEKEEKKSETGFSGDGGTGDYAAPWPGQHICFDPDAIRARGYVRSAQTVLGGVQGYTFYKADGTGQFMRQEMLLIQKLARKV